MNRFEVGQNTATDPYRQHLDLAVVEVDAVAEQVFGPSRCRTLVDADIVGTVRDRARGVLDLRKVLDTWVWMWQVRDARAPALRRLELGGRRGDGEARGDGVEAAAPAVPLRDAGLGVVIARLRRVREPGGALRSIITLPPTISMLRFAASAKRRRRSCGCTEQ
jgi:hypothetical protein